MLQFDVLFYHDILMQREFGANFFVEVCRAAAVNDHVLCAGSCRLDDPETLRACLRLLDGLEELEDVRSVTANLEAEATLLEAVLGHPQD